jgi:hypothetical protein
MALLAEVVLHLYLWSTKYDNTILTTKPGLGEKRSIASKPVPSL